MPTVAPIDRRLNLPAALNVLRWLTWDTFRQAIAARVFWVMLIVSATAVLFCASVGIRGGRVQHTPGEATEFLPRGSAKDLKETDRQGVVEVQGDLTLAFGAVRVPHARDANDSVHFSGSFSISFCMNPGNFVYVSCNCRLPFVNNISRSW